MKVKGDSFITGGDLTITGLSGDSMMITYDAGGDFPAVILAQSTGDTTLSLLNYNGDSDSEIITISIDGIALNDVQEIRDFVLSVYSKL